MKLRLTTLTDNTANYGFLAEWGMCFLLEVDGLSVLMDTGFSFSAVHNAQLMKIDLSTVDKIVLSHGHADHTGGLREVLRRTGPKEIIAHPGIWEAKYMRRRGEQERYVGIPFMRAELETLGASFNLTTRPVELSDRVITTGEVPLPTGYEQIAPDFYRKEKAGLQPDLLPDDLALAVKTEPGLVVIMGCAHRGLINTIRYLQNLTGEERVHTVIGGTHLFFASAEQVKQTTRDLKSIGIQRLGTCHCTGPRATGYLAEEFGDIFLLNNAGSSFTLP